MKDAHWVLCEWSLFPGTPTDGSGWRPAVKSLLFAHGPSLSSEAPTCPLRPVTKFHFYFVCLFAILAWNFPNRILNTFLCF